MKRGVPIILLLIHNPWTRELGEEDTHCTGQEYNFMYFSLCAQVQTIVSTDLFNRIVL